MDVDFEDLEDLFEDHDADWNADEWDTSEEWSTGEWVPEDSADYYDDGSWTSDEWSTDNFDDFDCENEIAAEDLENLEDLFEDFDIDVNFDDLFAETEPEDLEHLEDFLENLDGDMDLEDIL